MYDENYQAVNILFTTGVTRSGTINIGAHSRVSNLFTMNDVPFIVLETTDGKILTINKKQIVYVEIIEDKNDNIRNR